MGEPLSMMDGLSIVNINSYVEEEEGVFQYWRS